MADLQKKTKYINLVARKIDINISDRDKSILKWCKDNCENYAYIYHKNDKNYMGQIEHEHLHLVCVLNDSQRLSTTLYSFCDAVSLTTIGVEIDKCNSIEGSIQYLIHKNDPEKTQYEEKDIISNYGAELAVFLNSEADNITPQRLRALCRECKSNYELIAKLGINNYIRLRKVIADIKEDFKIWNY